MRNRRLAAGAHLLPLHVSGAWSYGFRHYPHGPEPVDASSSTPAGLWMSLVVPVTELKVQCLSTVKCRSLVPTDLGLAGKSDRHPILAAAGFRPRQPRLPAAGDCGARIGDFKSLVNMLPPFSVPRNGGLRFMLPLFHKRANKSGKRRI